MSSHSPTKGKVKKSAASSAKSSETAASRAARATSNPRGSKAKVETEPVEDQFLLGRSRIAAVASAAVKALTDEKPRDIPHRVEKYLAGVHPSLHADATRKEQAEQHLFQSIVIALQPFYSGNAD